MGMRPSACVDSEKPYWGSSLLCMVGSLCRFLIQVVGWVDAGLFGVEDGGGFSVSGFYLCNEVQLMRI